MGIPIAETHERRSNLLNTFQQFTSNGRVTLDYLYTVESVEDLFSSVRKTLCVHIIMTRDIFSHRPRQIYGFRGTDS